MSACILGFIGIKNISNMIFDKFAKNSDFSLSNTEKIEKINPKNPHYR